MMRGLLVLVLVGACGGRTSATSEPALANTQSAPRCEGEVCVMPAEPLVDELGIEHSRPSHAGDVVVVHFWATWAKASLADLPQMIGAWQTWHTRDVVFLGVLTTTATDDELRAVLEEYPLKYSLVRAPTREALLAYDYPTSVPQTFVFGRDGARVMHRVGALAESELERVLQSVAR